MRFSTRLTAPRSHREGRCLSRVLIAATAVATVLDDARAAELLLFTEPRCAACAVFEREVGRVDDRTAESRDAPLIRIRFGSPLSGPYDFVQRPKGSPTFVLVDGRNEVGRFAGYTSDELFWMNLAALLSKLETVESRAP